MGEYNNKVDKNQAEIVELLKRLGYSVRTLNKEKGGVPDLLISHKTKKCEYCGNDSNTYLIEAKSKTGKLTPPQKKFHANWQGKIFIIRNLGEIIKTFCE